MAHYALLDKNNIVVSVMTGPDEDSDIYDWEYYFSIEKRLKCKRTSYNTKGGVHILGGTPFRKNFAGVGFTYDAGRDAFISPKPFPSWVLDEDTCQWNPPVECPGAPTEYTWNEETQAWDSYE